MGWQDTFSAVYRDERFILTTIGVVSFAIVTTMIQTLTIIRDDNEVPPVQTKTQYITQDTENSLQLNTLEKLLGHTNYAISEIALRILYDRAINDPETIDILLRGITRPKYEERLESLHTLTILVRCSGGFNNVSALDDPKAYTALVRSLEIGLEDADLLDVRTPAWDEFNLRDAAEKMCLTLLAELGFQGGGKGIIKARFVEKWLAKQDWGKTPAERRKAFQSYMENRRNRIFHIVQKIKMYRRGLRALERAGLIDKELPDSTETVLMEYSQGSEPLVLRAREHSVEEQRLRRQHREAMVLNDGTRPLGREDIIERDHGVIID